MGEMGIFSPTIKGYGCLGESYKTYGLIATDPVSELKNSNIIPILPDNYQDNIWIRNREGMSKLTVDKVFKFICDKEKLD